MALSRPRFAVVAIVVSGSPLATVRLSTPAWDAGAIALAAGPLAACCCCRRCRCRRPRLCCSPAPLQGPQRPASPYPAAHASGCSHIRSACTLVPGPLLEGCEMDMALLLRMQCQTQGLPARAIRVSCMCASPGEAACGQLQCVWLPKRARDGSPRRCRMAYEYASPRISNCVADGTAVIMADVPGDRRTSKWRRCSSELGDCRALRNRSR